MDGFVTAINPRNGFVAVQTDGDEYTIVEFEDVSQVVIGDHLEWDNPTTGGLKRFLNWTQKRAIKGYLQNLEVPRLNVPAQLGLS